MTDDPHKRRKQIEDNLADLRAQRSDDVQRLVREKEEQEKNWKHANVDHVRGIIGGAELASAERELLAAREAATEATERQAIVGQAVREEEGALKKHLAEHFDVFAADCMKIAEKVEEYRDKANLYLDKVREQRATLARKWAPLIDATKLQRGVPVIDVQPVPTIPLRPPGVGTDGKIIRGTDEWGRPLGDLGIDRSERTARLLEQAQREAGGADTEAAKDAARAKTPEELAEEREQHKQEREANLQANEEVNA